MKKLTWILVIIGGLNWGLVGLGHLISNSNWNIVDLILGGGMFANIIYVVVGLSAVYALMGNCGCTKCFGGRCGGGSNSSM